MNGKPEPRKIKCPRCKQETEYSLSNLYRPFCSERCRLIDLGQWASEDFRIPTNETVSIQDMPNSDLENDSENQ